MLLKAEYNRALLKGLLEANSFGAFGYPVGFIECCRRGYFIEIRHGIFVSLREDVFPGRYNRYFVSDESHYRKWLLVNAKRLFG